MENLQKLTQTQDAAKVTGVERAMARGGPSSTNQKGVLPSQATCRDHPPVGDYLPDSTAATATL